jgi:hypothetical protein
MTIRSAWELRAMNATPQPGHYVALTESERRVLVEGPFATEEAATGAVAAVRDAWREADPWSESAAWGTATIAP